MDGLTDSKEVKELKQCDETHNDILEKDMKEDTSESVRIVSWQNRSGPQ